MNNKYVKYEGISIVGCQKEKVGNMFESAHFHSTNSTDGKVGMFIDLPKDDAEESVAVIMFKRFPDKTTKVDAMKWFLSQENPQTGLVSDMLREKIKNSSPEEMKSVKNAGIQALKDAVS